LYATKVVAINDIFDILTRAGIDYDAVKEGLRKSKMISPTHLDVFHKGGRGAGGKCLPKELGAFVIFAKNVGISNSLFVRVKEINDRLLERYPKK
jgi:UDP-glucose 6-dehydrogenase